MNDNSASKSLKINRMKNKTSGMWLYVGIPYMIKLGYYCKLLDWEIKWFDSKKGYGFIKEDKTDRDIFLHVSELENSRLKVLKEEQKLKFDIKEEKNKLQAINLKKAK